MNVTRLFDLITPLTLLALAGVFMIMDGLFHLGRDNNALQFIFGVPLAIGAAAFHFLIRRLAKRNTLYIWIIEAVIVAFMAYVFLHS